jgi:hypothetical protein
VDFVESFDKRKLTKPDILEKYFTCIMRIRRIRRFRRFGFGNLVDIQKFLNTLE